MIPSMGSNGTRNGLNMFSNSILRGLSFKSAGDVSQRSAFNSNLHLNIVKNNQQRGRALFNTYAGSSRTKFNSTLPSWTMILGVGIGVSSYCIADSFRSKIENSSSVRLYSGVFKDKGLISNKNMLESDKDAETYEIGLFISSQRELEVENEKQRLERMQSKIWFVYKLQYIFLDYVWENMITIGRFLEISLIFVPVFALYPICWFGKKHKNRHGTERYGSFLWYKLLRHSIELAGLSFIKLGQWAASRTDIFPTQLCEEFSNLHSNAKAHSLSQTKKVICKTFGIDNFDDIFEKFIDKPLGVGAIAQVYMAKLNQDVIKDAPAGWVAIKVLHPNVEIKIERDLRIMRFFANAIDFIPTMEWLSLPQEVEQFSLLMKLQLDLRIEGANLQKFQENFKSKNDIKFPTPYLEFTGREVLVEEYFDGISISSILDLSKLRDKNQLLKEISNKVLDSFLQMLILDNFIHADLHPGNIIIDFYKADSSKNSDEFGGDEKLKLISTLKSLKDDGEKLNDELTKLYEQGYRAKICYIDAGLVTELNEVDRVNFIELFNALSEFDGYRAGELMIERSRTPETVISNEIFALKVERLVDRIKQRTFTLGNLSIGDLLDQVLGMVRQHHVRMEGDFVTVIVAILLLEGIGRQLDPDLDLFASSLPVLRKLGLQDGKYILKSEDSLSMIKVWMALEIRQFIHASIQDIHLLVKSDGLCPNY